MKRAAFEAYAGLDEFARLCLLAPPTKRHRPCITTEKRSWQKSYELLVAYKSKHNNCLVPYNYSADPQLANWVQNQRSVFRSYQMNVARRMALDAIGFRWFPIGSYVPAEFTELAAWEQSNLVATVASADKVSPNDTIADASSYAVTKKSNASNSYFVPTPLKMIDFETMIAGSVEGTWIWLAPNWCRF
jgi:hypothetical protein